MRSSNFLKVAVKDIRQLLLRDFFTNRSRSVLERTRYFEMALRADMYRYLSLESRRNILGDERGTLTVSRVLTTPGRDTVGRQHLVATTTVSFGSKYRSLTVWYYMAPLEKVKLIFTSPATEITEFSKISAIEFASDDAFCKKHYFSEQSVINSEKDLASVFV